MGFLETIQMTLFGAREIAPVTTPLPSRTLIPHSSKSFIHQSPSRSPLSTSVSVRVSKVSTLNHQFGDLLQIISHSIEEFRLFDMKRVVVSVGTSRSRGKSGVWAYVTPLRYVGGNLFRRGLRRGVPGLYTYALGKADLEAPDSPLYLMTFLVPRFFFLTFEERIETLVHELYHLHPQFRGDLRRFPRPHIHHGPTPKAYDRKVRELVNEALQRNPLLRTHPLLSGEGMSFEKTKKLRVTRPTLKFVPKFFALLLVVFSANSLWAQESKNTYNQDRLEDDASWPPRPSLLDEQKRGRDWQWPWEEKKSQDEANILDPLKGDFVEYDETHKSKEGVRYLVSPTEELNLKTAPSEWSADLLAVKPGQTYYAYSLDKTGKWVFLRTRKIQGWAQIRFLKVVGQLQSPPSGGNYSDFIARGAGMSKTKAEAGQGPEVNDSNLLSFDRDLDNVYTVRGGPLHEQPDPLAIRYGQLQAGDKVSILKRDGTGEWSYVRLLLTSEEGWFPSEWLKISRGYKVQGAGKGLIAIDLDGAYGAGGRNLGGGIGLFFDLLGAKTTKDSRFEMGAFYSYFSGENLQYVNQNTSETYSLSSRYSLLGLGGRYVGFASEGLLGGGVEGAITYQRTIANVTGLDADVLAASGIAKDLEPKIGVLLGLRGIISINSWLQANTLVRVNFASGSTSYWAGAGLSFRIF